MEKIATRFTRGGGEAASALIRPCCARATFSHEWEKEGRRLSFKNLNYMATFSRREKVALA